MNASIQLIGKVTQNPTVIDRIGSRGEPYLAVRFSVGINSSERIDGEMYGVTDNVQVIVSNYNYIDYCKNHLKWGDTVVVDGIIDVVTTRRNKDGLTYVKGHVVKVLKGIKEHNVKPIDMASKQRLYIVKLLKRAMDQGVVNADVESAYRLAANIDIAYQG